MSTETVGATMLGEVGNQTIPLFDPVCRIKFRSGQLKKSLSGLGRSHPANEIKVQFAGGPPPLLAGRNLRPEFLVQGLGLFGQL